MTTPHTEGDSHYPVRGRPLAAVSHSASQQHGSTAAPPTPTTPHTPRVIDHVPYLSRQWGGGEERGVSRSASWRERHVSYVLSDIQHLDCPASRWEAVLKRNLNGWSLVQVTVQK